MESFLGIDIKDFTQQFIEVCKFKKINYIVTVSNRGNMLLEEIIKHNPDFTKSLDLLGIKVCNEKDLVRKSLYGKVSNSNILLFDDLIKTEEHIKSAREKIEKGINSCDETNNQQNTQFSYYAVYRYENSNIEDEQINDNLCIYGTKSGGAYYQFGIDEGIYFQKNLLPSSDDLPLVTKGTIDSIDDLIDALRGYRDTHVVIDEFKIGNEKFPLINVFFDEFKFPKDDKGLVLSSTLIIRYEKNESGDKYNVLITPFVLTKSMKADTLQSLYYDMYGEMIENVSDHFLMMYRKLVHNFSFYLAEEIVDRFENSGYRFKLSYDALDLYDDEYTKSLIHYCFKEFSGSNKNIQTYNENTVTENSRSSRKELFETLIYEPKKKDYAYNYNFCPIENLSYLLEEPSYKLNFISMLYGYLENYSISNELKYNKDTNTIERGFHIEESSLCYSPVEDRIYYRMLKRFYEKCRKNYNIFKENYPLIHYKAEHYFWDNNYSDYIRYGDFLYLKKYYYNLTENQLIDEIESKEYKLNDADDELDGLYYFEDKLSYILASDDFTFNMNASQRNTFEEEKALLRKKNK